MKRLRTLRVRFALGTALLILIVLSVFGVYIYESMSRRLASAIDDSLELVAAQVISGIEFGDNRPFFSETLSEEPENIDLRQRGYSAWVFTPKGELLASFGRYQSIGLSPGGLAAAPEFATLVDAESDDVVRLRIAPVSGGSGPTAFVQVAKSLEELSETLGDLRTTLMVAVPVLVAVAGLGGYLLAARGLAPIDRITQTAQRISAEDLSARIDLPPIDDEVGRLARTFDAMLARIEGSFRRERQFSADASHELRTPLSAIQAILGAVRQRQRTVPEYQQALADLSEEADRLQTVAADLLQLARPERLGSIPREPVDLSTLLNDLTDSFRSQAEAKDITLTNDVPGGLTVLGSSDDLIRLFANLIDNAVKYAEGGAVDLSADSLASRVTVTIADTGGGISEEHLPRIFDRFYRADSSRASPGAGLGLAIALEIAHAHGASLEASSEVGVGSRFRVVFPRG